MRSFFCRSIQFCRCSVVTQSTNLSSAWVQDCDCAVPVYRTPAGKLQSLNQRSFVRQQRLREMELVPGGPPPGSKLNDSRVIFEEFSAEQVASTVEKNLLLPV